MQYNSQAQGQDIVTLARTLAGADADALPINEVTLYANIIGAKVWNWIFQSYGGMKYDDKNQSGSPTTADNVVLNQTTYTIPTAALTITGIEIKDQGGFWKKLIPITEEEIRERIALGDFHTIPGNPIYYRWEGDEITLYPAANYNSTAGLKYFYDRADIEFLYNDTTKEPGFASVFHEVIAIGIAEQFCAIEGKARAQGLANKLTSSEADIRDFYSKLHKAHSRPRVRVADATPGLMDSFR